MTPKKAKPAKPVKEKEETATAKPPSKNALLVQFYTDNPEGSRSEAAAFAGCSSSQVLWMFNHGKLPEGTGAARQGGQTKADLIVAYYAEHPDAKRQEVAEACGCTVQRVGEAVRAGLTSGVGVKRTAAPKELADKKPAKAKKAKKPVGKVEKTAAEKKAFSDKMAKARAAKKAGKTAEDPEVTAARKKVDAAREAAADAAELDDLGGEE